MAKARRGHPRQVRGQPKPLTPGQVQRGARRFLRKMGTVPFYLLALRAAELRAEASTGPLCTATAFAQSPRNLAVVLRKNAVTAVRVSSDAKFTD